jgi:PhnB protein
MDDRAALTDDSMITPHIVVADADAAASWYRDAFGAEERDRLPLPNGKVMYIELRLGRSTVMIADEFPEFGILSPIGVGGTAVVLHMTVQDVDAAWRRALDAGATVAQPLQDQF